MFLGCFSTLLACFHTLTVANSNIITLAKLSRLFEKIVKVIDKVIIKCFERQFYCVYTVTKRKYRVLHYFDGLHINLNMLHCNRMPTN